GTRLAPRLRAVPAAAHPLAPARPSRPRRTTDQITATLGDGAGQQWDAEVVSAFLACRQQLFGISQQGLGTSVRKAVGRLVGPDSGTNDSDDAPSPEGRSRAGATER